MSVHLHTVLRVYIITASTLFCLWRAHSYFTTEPFQVTETSSTTTRRELSTISMTSDPRAITESSLDEVNTEKQDIGQHEKLKQPDYLKQLQDGVKQDLQIQTNNSTSR